MIRRRLGILALGLGLVGFACGSGGGASTNTDTTAAGQQVAVADTAAAAGSDPGGAVVPVTGSGCKFDKAKEGKTLHEHIGNFGLKGFWNGETEPGSYFLHENCGQKKAIWLILATGW